jgi:endonuclease/exonuclease/phosphatase family metal-dependent hydrolase
VPLVVRTWNLFHGNADPPARRGFLREMVELVVADRPDVVCLQEVPLWAFGELERWSGMQAFTGVARHSRLRSPRLGRLVTELHHGLLRSAFTGEGAAILVARGRRAADPRTVVVGERPLRRVALALQVDGAGLVVDFHVDADADALRRVAALAAGEPQAVLAGDANLRPPYDLDGWSEPLAGSIDQVLARGHDASPPAAWPVERRTVDGRVLSDHAPVELRLG